MKVGRAPNEHGTAPIEPRQDFTILRIVCDLVPVLIPRRAVAQTAKIKEAQVEHLQQAKRT